jgi:hypothetical protein
LEDDLGVVFVADGSREKCDQNIRYLENLFRILEHFREMFRFSDDGKGIPIIIQWNKNDLENPMPFKEFLEYSRLGYRLRGPEIVNAVAVEGIGVYYSLKRCVDIMNIDAMDGFLLV